MCKIISSEAVIGNFILESLERNYFTVSIKKIVEYDNILSQKLESYDYFITIELDDFMIDLIKENYNIELEEWSLYKMENKTIEKINSIDM